MRVRWHEALVASVGSYLQAGACFDSAWRQALKENPPRSSRDTASSFVCDACWAEYDLRPICCKCGGMVLSEEISVVEVLRRGCEAAAFGDDRAMRQFNRGLVLALDLSGPARHAGRASEKEASVAA